MAMNSVHDLTWFISPLTGVAIGSIQMFSLAMPAWLAW